MARQGRTFIECRVADEEVYNPLDTRRLGADVARELLSRPTEPLPPTERFRGAGIYLIYYAGDFGPYRPISKANAGGKWSRPIYIGKSGSKGWRKGPAILTSPARTTALSDRLRVHARRIGNATNLSIDDFTCKYLVVEQIWVPLAEAILIERFRPLWNSLVDGFGNNDPGSGRHGQKLSPWDVLHPGRTWAKHLKPSARSQAEIEKAIQSFFADE